MFPRESRWDEEEGHDGHDHAEGAAHSYDPHIWTNPVYAKTMVQTITDALCRVDPDNQADYEQNAQTYQEELSALDEEIGKWLPQAKEKLLFLAAGLLCTTSLKNMAWSMFPPMITVLRKESRVLLS